MRILFVTPQSPSPTGGGAAIRNWHLIRAARDAGHTVDVVTPDARTVPRRTATDRLRDLLLHRAPDLAYRVDSPHFTHAISVALTRAAAAGEPFDIVQIEGLEVWESVAAALPGHRVTTIYDAHNAEARLQARTARNAAQSRHPIGAVYSAVQWAKLRAYERDAMQAATATLALSSEDARALASLSGRRVDVVPVGVETAYFSPDAPDLPPPISFDLVFSGTLDYRPNADAARWLVREVWPLVRAVHPRATLAVVGRNPLPELRAHDGQDGVTVTGAVSDDRPYMAGAAVYTLPIRFGAGVRLKLLNAMSMGCAVVATPAATEGVVVQNGRDLLLAPPNARGFAAGIAAALTFPAIRARYGAAARRLMIAQHEWARVTPSLLAVYARIEREHQR